MNRVDIWSLQFFQKEMRLGWSSDFKSLCILLYAPSFCYPSHAAILPWNKALCCSTQDNLMALWYCPVMVSRCNRNSWSNSYRDIMAAFSMPDQILCYTVQLLKGILVLYNHTNQDRDKRQTRRFSSQHSIQLWNSDCYWASSVLLYIHASLFKFPIKQCNPPGEISLIYIHMQIQKENRHSFKEKKKRRKGKSSAYHHSTDVETKCVGLSVSSLRLSRAKLQRWPVWMDQVNQLQPRKNISIVSVICSHGRGGNQDETLQLPKASGQTEEIHFPRRCSEGTLLQDSTPAR